MNKLEMIEALTQKQMVAALVAHGAENINSRATKAVLSEQLMAIPGVPVVVNEEMVAANPEAGWALGEVTIMPELEAPDEITEKTPADKLDEELEKERSESEKKRLAALEEAKKEDEKPDLTPQDGMVEMKLNVNLNRRKFLKGSKYVVSQSEFEVLKGLGAV